LAFRAFVYGCQVDSLRKSYDFFNMNFQVLLHPLGGPFFKENRKEKKEKKKKRKKKGKKMSFLGLE